MRIYHSVNEINENYTSLSPRNFPHIFAVCRNIHPYPQFQILSIERVRGYDEHSHYRFMNEPLDNVEMVVDHNGNPTEHQYGQMYIIPHRDIQPLRVRFEIRNVFLVSQRDVFPIVVMDNMDSLPPMDAVIVPRNCQPNRNYNNQEPYFMMNYLMNTQNFDIADMSRFQNAMRGLDRMRRDRTRRERNWYDDDTRRRDISPPRPPMRDIPYHPSSYYGIRDDWVYNMSDTEYPAAAGAGAGDRRTRRARRDTVSPPRTPPPTATTGQPQQLARPATTPALQAFTIQALIGHAIKENLTCPISMNPIEPSTACITSCQHVFERESIQRWLADHENCPVCRQAVSICN